jgi:proteasome lid subunit RPN8/RPN11
VFAHCLAAAPHEAVGLVVRAADQALCAIPLVNVSPTPATAFEISPRQWMRVEAAVRAHQGVFHALYHSHLDAPAVLSEQDQHGLAPGGLPLISGLMAWVISVRGGRISEARASGFNGVRYEPLESQKSEAIESVLFRKGCFGL